MQSRFALQSAMQRFQMDEKKWIKSMKVEYSEDNPDQENTLSTLAVFMGKEIMYHSKKSCYRIPIHYDPEL
jgi:hypothetical protein